MEKCNLDIFLFLQHLTAALLLAEDKLPASARACTANKCDSDSVSA